MSDAEELGINIPATHKVTPKGALVLKAKQLGLSIEDGLLLWDTLKDFCDINTKEYKEEGIESSPCLIFEGGGIVLRIIKEKPKDKPSDVTVH